MSLSWISVEKLKDKGETHEPRLEIPLRKYEDWYKKKKTWVIISISITSILSGIRKDNSNNQKDM